MYNVGGVSCGNLITFDAELYAAQIHTMSTDQQNKPVMPLWDEYFKAIGKAMSTWLESGCVGSLKHKNTYLHHSNEEDNNKPNQNMSNIT